MIGARLIKWFKQHKRDLPWRNTTDPYKVWLSEIILQQTRVAQGMPYYLSFVKEFPTVFDLAKAPEQKVLKLWQGLGYYSRARNLHTAAKEVVKNYKGIFPSEFEELKKLKGVGDYTAAAISSFCFNKPQAVVDGNVYRVLARLFAIDTPVNSTEGKKQFALLAQELLDKKNAGTYNQAIMEFGALYCTPHKPDCEACIFYDTCLSGSESKALNYPVKIANKKMTTRYFEYFVIISNQNTYTQQRTENDIWKNLHQFPLLEYAEKANDTKVLEQLKKEILKTKTNNFEIIKQTGYKKHQLSHQTIYARFTYINVNKFVNPTYKQTSLKQLKKLPFPVLLANEISEL
ncbi:MAG TPA: A/G-specific adenine glycosylase [Bacteroidia bacterium]|nr:A/G-specific adenine glycosylase [Bacteroidia bacterium]